MAGVVAIDPLADPRWDELVARHPRASVFHTRGWIEALQRTYGYEPVVLTTTAHGPLENGLVVCRVRTWFARRLVSLPFSDHCEPLVDRTRDLSALIESLTYDVEAGRWRSFEIRPASELSVGLAPGARYWLHTLDLARPPARLFAGFHASSTRRAIRRAEREGIEYEAGRSESLLTAFYGLLRLTRRRHGLPPQPLVWFRHLRASLRDALTIHLARRDGAPIAAILTLAFGRTLVYKYGGSDARQHRLGAMPLLFWRAIEQAQADGFETLDLGRSDLDQAGLIAFKQHLGATPHPLAYYTHPGRHAQGASDGTLARAARRLLARLPDPALDLTGRIIHRHLG